MNQYEVPLIDLSPRLKRPLLLWNPLDYLRLVFWAFFFPQAIRWYVEAFIKPDYLNVLPFKNFKEFRKLLHDDPILTKLIIQTIAAPLISVPCIYFILKKFNVPINWIGLGWILVFNWNIGKLTERKKDSSIDIEHEVLSSLIINIEGSVIFGMGLNIVFGFKGVVTIIVSISILITVTMYVVVGMSIGYAFKTDIQLGQIKTMYLGVGCFTLVCGVALILTGVSKWVILSLIAILASIIISIRPLEYAITTLYLLFFPKKEKLKFLPHICRMVFLPLPGIQKQLENHLDIDWEKGVENANQLLSYSFQFISVVKAVKKKLEHSPEDIMLVRISALATKLYDWQLIPVMSEKSIRLYLKKDSTPQLDTAVNAACAGFWFWHNKEANNALKAFSIVRNLRHGQELFHTARVIDLGITLNDLKTISAWGQETNWLYALPDPELRPGTLKTLRMLHAIARESLVAINARDPLKRLTAANCATTNLNTLIETGHTFCPEPEWPLILELLQKWQEIFNQTGDFIRENVLNQPALNPYEGYSGLAVSGSTFTGRADILGQIETHWAVGGLMPVFILYGHHRMGKTSILKSLANIRDLHYLFVYLNPQKWSMIDHTYQILRDITEEVHKIVSECFSDIGILPAPTAFSGIDNSRRTFESLMDRIALHLTEGQRVILVIDQFEIIENLISNGKVYPELLSYLRSINQHYQWLGLIFAGLYNLEERGRDYHFEFYGQTKTFRVSYLTYAETKKLITQPHPDFCLEYEDSLINEIYRITFGQPYLVQFLCWELVNHWNDQFLGKGASMPRILKLEDLASVLTPSFYQNAKSYFYGVWRNVTENEQQLMRLIAGYENKPLFKQNLVHDAVDFNLPKDPMIIDKTLKLLIHHDIILKKEIRFACELLRQWVQHLE